MTQVFLLVIKLYVRTYFFVLLTVIISIFTLFLEASEPKCVNSLYDIIGVNSLRLRGLQLLLNIFAIQVGLILRKS